MFHTFVALHARNARVDVSRKETGATVAEYAFLLSLIALVAFAAVRAFGNAVEALLALAIDKF
ncbi:hypothetical protein GCM10011492_38100 [Flexivirga endophytica]|uniref:Flp family type IVb pilin n=1 Tax=Flexivirga endophytica TaxID=1849103 RepID=A0A916TGV8_9MICO|nr:hypothetical protein [Flexivirga endophytica]GGB43484.1 hypothetical protein GCM10011492_38100 [Flexivirga endophytica]GHB68366.1 hypothetical protein GCM10008112_41410 [Flexivirga endophytica]